MLRSLKFDYSINELKKDSKNFIEFLKNNKVTIMLIWFFILMSYGIKLFNYNISIDTEAIINNYEGLLNSWLSIGRFGLIIIKRIFGLCPFNTYVACFLMLCTIFLFSIFLSFIFFKFSFVKNNKIGITVFPLFFLTSPLFAEQFNFILQGFEVALAILMCFIASFLITKWILDKDLICYLLVGIIILTLSFSSYQAIIFLYISVTLSIYFTICDSTIKKKTNFDYDTLKVATVKYILSFVLAYALYFFINKIVSLKIGSTIYLNNMIIWGTCSPLVCIRSILGYMLRDLVYIILAILLFVSSFIKLFSKSKLKVLYFLSSISLLASPFFLAICLGHGLINRSQFSLQFVTAFLLYFIILRFSCNSASKTIKKYKFIFILTSISLIFSNAYKVSNYMLTEYMKYQSEINLANKISSKIESLDLDNISKYPVVFSGSLHPLSTPNELLGETLGKSFFEWDKECDFGSNYRILGFMKTIGYSYKLPTEDEIKKGNEIAKSMSKWPNSHSVIFKDNIIVVNLSE